MSGFHTIINKFQQNSRLTLNFYPLVSILCKKWIEYGKETNHKEIHAAAGN